ncbi:MAG: hypothetical protein DLM62_06100 [Pseudonocardiales bacterium]|nr:MAG: hypothetical protein DLM62_06100 [Pseudonocardiales bacterium]
MTGSLTSPPVCCSPGTHPSSPSSTGDITRERIPHLSLSHGAHFCLGAHLARVELQYLFVRALQRFPALRLAVPLEEIQPLREAVAGAVSQLPVAW